MIAYRIFVGFLAALLGVAIAVGFFAMTARAHAAGSGRQVGIASFYGAGERLARHTANGERFNPKALTCAHRRLPFGTRVLVFHRQTGRSVVCRVNDRGPAKWTGRIIDLSRGAARVLHMTRMGTAPVVLTVVR